MKIRNILLVEDDQLDVIDFRRALDKLNILYSLVVAKNGEEAIELLNKEGTPQLEHLPDFLLIDINMPKMNGLEFLEIVRNREKWKHLKCFIITTSDEDVDRDAANRLGVAGYTFLGYRDVSGQSSIDTIVPVSDGVPDACNTGTGVTIDYTNNMLWVPLTGPDGNIIAEIFPNGQNLGTITSSFYKNSGPLRMRNGSTYADRNITITPQNQPASPVKVRIYLSKKEYDAFDANPLSGITSLADLRIHKNSDPCQSAIAAATSIINPAFKLKHNDSGYVLQADISGFSTFYIGSTSALLPLTSLNFQGRYKDGTAYLNWETSNESNTKYFDVERNTGDGTYTSIGTVAAKGTESGKTRYTLNDNEASGLGTSRLFYRLKITDKDGSYTYSNVVVVDIPGTFITRISVFPNPADKQTTVMIASPEEQKVTMQLVDVTGRSVINRTVVLKKGENRLSIDLNALRTGVYFLQVKGQFVNAQEKIQKL